jgi:hypothetical protein
MISKEAAEELIQNGEIKIDPKKSEWLENGYVVHIGAIDSTSQYIIIKSLESFAFDEGVYGSLYIHPRLYNSGLMMMPKQFSTKGKINTIMFKGDNWVCIRDESIPNAGEIRSTKKVTKFCRAGNTVLEIGSEFGVVYFFVY